jgi:hypothetical protein
LRQLGILLPDLSIVLYLLLPAAELPSRLISKSFSGFEETLFGGSGCGHPAFCRFNQS